MTISVDGGSITFLYTKILQKKNPHKNRHLISGGYRNIGTGGGGGSRVVEFLGSWNCFNVIPYPFTHIVVSVENKIHIVHIAC